MLLTWKAKPKQSCGPVHKGQGSWAPCRLNSRLGHSWVTISQSKIDLPFTSQGLLWTWDGAACQGGVAGGIPLALQVSNALSWRGLAIVHGQFHHQSVQALAQPCPVCSLASPRGKDAQATVVWRVSGLFPFAQLFHHCLCKISHTWQSAFHQSSFLRCRSPCKPLVIESHAQGEFLYLFIQRQSYGWTQSVKGLWQEKKKIESLRSYKARPPRKLNCLCQKAKPMTPYKYRTDTCQSFIYPTVTGPAGQQDWFKDFRGMRSRALLKKEEGKEPLR